MDISILVNNDCYVLFFLSLVYVTAIVNIRETPGVRLRTLFFFSFPLNNPLCPRNLLWLFLGSLFLSSL